MRSFVRRTSRAARPSTADRRYERCPKASASGNGRPMMNPWALSTPNARSSLERLGLLRSLGGGRHAERLGQVDHGGDHVTTRGLVVEVANEFAVDLQHRDRQPLQVGESPVADAKVVEGDAASQTIKPRTSSSAADTSRTSAVSVISHSMRSAEAPAW